MRLVSPGALTSCVSRVQHQTQARKLEHNNGHVSGRDQMGSRACFCVPACPDSGSLLCQAGCLHITWYPPCAGDVMRHEEV